MRVLIVEDIMENRYLLSYLIKAQGWEVSEAVDGAEAIEFTKNYTPDLILMDIGLPGELSGYQLVGVLRIVPHLSQVPIIAVTSYAMGGDREEALAAGCNGYIEKPIDVTTFISQVETVMRQSKLN